MIERLITFGHPAIYNEAWKSDRITERQWLDMRKDIGLTDEDLRPVFAQKFHFLREKEVEYFSGLGFQAKDVPIAKASHYTYLLTQGSHAPVSFEKLDKAQEGLELTSELVGQISLFLLGAEAVAAAWTENLSATGKVVLNRKTVSLVAKALQPLFDVAEALTRDHKTAHQVVEVFNLLRAGTATVADFESALKLIRSPMKDSSWTEYNKRVRTILSPIRATLRVIATAKDLPQVCLGKSPSWDVLRDRASRALKIFDNIARVLEVTGR